MNIALINFAIISGFLTFLTPCGIAMIPAYISYYLGKNEKSDKINLFKKIKIGSKIGFFAGLGIISIFVLIGVLVISLGNFIKGFVPWFTILGGIFLVFLGGFLIFKKDFHFNINLLKFLKIKPSFQNFYIFGIVYGLAVMSCSFPIFLSITLGALSLSGFSNMIFVFSLYALSSALSMIIFSLILAVLKEGVLRFLKGIFPYIQKTAGIIVILSGIYLIYYQIKVNRAFDLIGVFIPLFSKELYELRKKGKKAEKLKKIKNKKMKKIFKVILYILVFVAIIYLFGLYIITRPYYPPTTIIGHSEGVPPSQILKTPIKDSVQRHMIEHAWGRGRPGVIIQYNCTKFKCEKDLIRKLENIVKDYNYVFLAPNIYDGKIILTKFNRMKILDKFDEKQIRNFIEK